MRCGRRLHRAALRGEATPVYLESRVAIPELLGARPDARLIAMIRNPVEMVASRHGNLAGRLVKRTAIWRPLGGCRSGGCAAKHCHSAAAETWVARYRAYAAIGDMLERFIALVPAGQRIVIVYDDFRADTRWEYLRVLALLGLADDGRTEFAPVNNNVAERWPGMPDFQQRLRGRALYRPAAAVAHASGFQALLDPREANKHTGRNASLSGPNSKQELIADFLPQVEKVERLLGRDLGGVEAAGGGAR